MALRILIRRPLVRIVPQIRCFSSTNPEKSIILETDPKTGISTMILNRPPVNSLGMNFMQEIIQTIDTLVWFHWEKDLQCSLVKFKGTGSVVG